MDQSTPEPRILTREEFAKVLEEHVSHDLSMSLPKFHEAVDSGAITTPASTDLAILLGVRSR